MWTSYWSKSGLSLKMDPDSKINRFLTDHATLNLPNVHYLSLAFISSTGKWSQDLKLEFLRPVHISAPQIYKECWGGRQPLFVSVKTVIYYPLWNIYIYCRVSLAEWISNESPSYMRHVSERASFYTFSRMIKTQKTMSMAMLTLSQP